MQVHVHSHALTPPVWTMSKLSPERPSTCLRGAIDASIRGSHVLGYEPAAYDGSATHLACDAATRDNMIESGPDHRSLLMHVPLVTSE